MTNRAFPVALEAAAVPPRTRTIYPAPLAACVAGREKLPLGDAFGLANFGVNLTRLKPGSASALRHSHSRQDEFVYILAGEPVLVTDTGETPLKPGMCILIRPGVRHRAIGRMTVLIVVFPKFDPDDEVIVEEP